MRKLIEGIRKYSSFVKKYHYPLAVGIVLFFMVGFSLSEPPNPAHGDITLDQNAGTWEGNLSPLSPQGTDIYQLSNVAISDDLVSGSCSANPPRCQATLTGSNLSGSMTSVSIVPTLAKFLGWSVVDITATNISAASYIRYDIICGDQTSGCSADGTSYNNAFPGFSNLALPTTGQFDISSIKTPNIRIRATWTRDAAGTASSILNKWGATWKVKNSLSLYVTKSLATANPTLYTGGGGPPAGTSDNHTVTYTLYWSSDTAADNTHIEIPFPVAKYEKPIGTTLKTYRLTYQNGGTQCTNSCPATVPTGCSTTSTYKVYWDLGSISSGQSGSVSVTFKVPSGPTNGLRFSTSPSICGSDAGNGAILGPFSYQLGDLIISAKAILDLSLQTPEYISDAADTSGGIVNILLIAGAVGGAYQSDLFNVKHTLSFNGTCWAVDDAASGSVPWVVQNPGLSTAKLVFTTGNIIGQSQPSLYWKVRFVISTIANCNDVSVSPAKTRLNWNISSDQSGSYLTNPNKIKDLQVDNAGYHFSVTKGYTAESGLGAKIDYSFEFNQTSNRPIAGFCAKETIPTSTTFLYANMSVGELYQADFWPNGSTANPINIYTSTAGPQPSCTDPTAWTKISNSGVPCSPYCLPGSGTIRHVMWRVDGATNLLWDSAVNGDLNLGSMSILVNPGYPGPPYAAVQNQIKAYGTNTCTVASGGCVSSTVSTIISNKPNFRMSFDTDLTSCCANIVNADSYIKLHGVITNNFDGSGTSTGNAKNVQVLMKVPESKYMDTGAPTIAVGAPITAYCNKTPSTNCPKDTVPTFQDPSPSLTGTYCASNAASCPTYTWQPKGTVAWLIPFIYNGLLYPEVFPNSYNFYVSFKAAKGHPDLQTANCITPPLPSSCTLTATDGVQPTITKTVAMTPDIRIHADVKLVLCESHDSALSSCPLSANPPQSDLDSTADKYIGYGDFVTQVGLVPVHLNYSTSDGNGSPVDPYLLLQIPSSQSNPPTKLRACVALCAGLGAPYTPAYTSKDNFKLYWIADTQYTNTKPATLLNFNGCASSSNPAGWKDWAANPPTDEKTVTWVMWRQCGNLGLVPPGAVPPPPNQKTILTYLLDTGSPTGSSYSIQAWSGSTSSVDNDSQTASDTFNVFVLNPGFIKAFGNGDIGSVGQLHFNRVLQTCNAGETGCLPTAVGSNCNTPPKVCQGNVDSLAIGNDINDRDSNSPPNCCTIASALKQWVIKSYSPGINTNATNFDYDKYWTDYQASATTCTDVNSCLASGGAKKYSPSGGFATFAINSTTTNSYTASQPLILFVDAGSPPTSTAIKVDRNFAIGGNTGVIFAVRGDVSIDPGVEQLDGVFLIQGKFNSGTLGKVSGIKDAGREAVIKVDQQGYAAIVYLADTQVRLIRCSSYDCTNRNYSFIANVTSGNSIKLSLEIEAKFLGFCFCFIYNPKIAITETNTAAGTSKITYVSCNDNLCASKDTTLIDNAHRIDAVVKLDPNAGYLPTISNGYYLSPDTTHEAHTTTCSDAKCSVRTDTRVDGALNNETGKGNQLSFDFSSAPVRPVLMYHRITGFFRYLSVARPNAAASCNSIAGWECNVVINGFNNGNFGPYPAFDVTNLSGTSQGNGRILFVDENSKGLFLINCGDSIPSRLCNSGDYAGKYAIDCGAIPGANCETFSSTPVWFEPAVSMIVQANTRIPRFAYVVKNTSNNLFELRYGTCTNTVCNAVGNFTHTTLVNNITPPDAANPWAVQTINISNQAIAVGRTNTDAVFQNPRVVYYNAKDKNLFFISCNDPLCASKDTPLNLDAGDPLTLTDPTLTINGSILGSCPDSDAAYKCASDPLYNNKALALSRDRFNLSGQDAGEIFYFQPRYYYIFTGSKIWKSKSVYSEPLP